MKVTLENKAQVKELLLVAGWQGSVSAGLDPDTLFNEQFEKIGKKCIESGHLSVTRPCLFTFRIEGMSRACSHQFVRENVGVFIVQESQRYVTYRNGIEHVIPPSIGNNLEAYNKFEYLQAISEQTYKELVDMGIPAEDARFAFTNACATKIHVSMTYEALLRVASKRRCNRAQWEIREIVAEMCKQVREVNEYMGAKLVAQCDVVGYCVEEKCCGKRPTKAQFFATYEKGRIEEKKYADHVAEREALALWLKDPKNVESIMEDLFMHHQGLSASTLLQKIEGVTNTFEMKEEAE